MKPARKQFACPICKSGEGPERYTEATLSRHLWSFHRRLDVDDLIDRCVSRVLLQRSTQR